MTEGKFLKSVNIQWYLKHLQRTSLIWEGKNYRIKPGEAFYFKDKVLLVEFESNRRLVESISTFWWLFKETDWPNNEIGLELHFVILKSHFDEIRERSVQILGEELA